ncbi:hypothetical protein C8F04DRAFT_1230037 [Mycena alexandri]|uniref:FAD-binding PCMH-type domain-containing protein n=1 Tax=Mycena alexandri TaxID=1745969 RepID=A0AAD6X7H6_9AGAR|nr:hypothetical protein C8F04DRAFT_1230037 [Mycena alexandri]
MFPVTLWLLSLSSTSAETFLGPDAAITETATVGELPDLVQTGIWLENNKTQSAGVYCCDIMKGVFPDQVFFPDSAEYQAQQGSYYSLRQSDLHPACRVSPTSAMDVASIVTFSTQHGCPFAVRSGGHMSWKGSSNVDSSGFTIDLQKMTEISVVDDGKVVSFGSGCRWRQVYSALEPHNLTTSGARIPNVGVSGFLLGGGISALSLAHGFASSSVVNYQVVLADGTIKEVNENNLPDLYWALKYGSTNFAIVTRFDMITYPLSDVWAGTLILDISKGPALLQFHVDLTANLAMDPLVVNFVAFTWDPLQQTYIIWSPNIYLSPVAYPPPYSDIQTLVADARHNTMRITDFLNAIEEIGDMAPSAERVEWCTLTLKPDATLLWDIHLKGVEIFEPFVNGTGFSYSTVSQALNRRLAAASANKGGNPTGISAEDGDHLVVLFMASWSDPADDEQLKEKTQEHCRYSEHTARERGLLHPFIYMNYASSVQDVMGSLGEETRARMRKIKNLYDPENRFGLYWKGGFKL